MRPSPGGPDPQGTPQHPARRRAVPRLAAGYRSWTAAPTALLVGVVVIAVTARWPASPAAVLGLVALGCVLLQTLLTRHRSHDPGPWRRLGVGTGLVVFSSPAVLQAALAQTAVRTWAQDPTVAAVSVAAALVAYPLAFSGSLRLLHYRRHQVVPHVHAWFDGLGSLLGLGAILAAAPVPALVAAGTAPLQAWALLGRPVLVLVLTAFAVANCQLVGWRTDRRLLKVLAVFVLLLTAEVLDLLAIGAGVGAGGAAPVAAGLRAGALVLLAAAAWRPAPRPTAGSTIGWAALSAPVSISALTMVAGYLGVRGGATSPVVFALTVAASGIVVLKVLVLVRTLVALLESRRLSLVDDLTGLPNRRAFFEAVDGLPDRTGVAVMLLDLNGFKKVNDTLGHAFGDALLQDTARLLESVVPERSTLARLGGDEFVVLLPAAGAAVVEQVAQDLLRVLGPRSLDGHPLQVSASIGVAQEAATGPADGPNAPTARGGRRATDTAARRREVEALLHQADGAMYEAKQAGGGWRSADRTHRGADAPGRTTPHLRR